jgi:PilZ domain
LTPSDLPRNLTTRLGFRAQVKTTYGSHFALEGFADDGDTGPWETIVALTKETSYEQRMKKIRAGIRLNSRVAVAVEWTEDGRTLHAEGYTLDISPKGCLAIFPQGFAVGQRLRLINLTNQSVCDAVLVWRGHEGRGGWELGLELQKMPSDFWGLDF